MRRSNARETTARKRDLKKKDLILRRRKDGLMTGIRKKSADPQAEEINKNQDKVRK